MKIVCGSCAAKYTVSDDKVHGKTVKVKCRKCGAVIVVSASGEVQTQGGSQAGGGASFTVSVSDTDQRTMTMGQIVASYNEGTIDADTFVWSEGMDDWRALKDVDAIVDALHDAAHGGGEVPAEAAHEGDEDLGRTMAMPEGGLPNFDAQLAARQASSQARTAALPQMQMAGGGGDDLGSTMAMDEGQANALARGYGGGSLPTAPAAPAYGGGGGGMFGGGGGGAGLFGGGGGAAVAAPFGGGGGAKGEENSAIFSLNTLSAKAAGAPAQAKSNFSGNEDSGLIDLKALAAGGGGGGGGGMGGGDFMAQAAAASPAGGLFPMGAPPPMAQAPMGAPVGDMPKQGSNKGLIMALGLVVVALLAVVVFMLVKGSTPQPTADSGKGSSSSDAARGEKTAKSDATDKVADAPPPATSAAGASEGSTKVASKGPPPSNGKAPTPPPPGKGAPPPPPGGGTPPPPPPPPAGAAKGACGCAADDLMCLMRCGAKKKK